MGNKRRVTPRRVDNNQADIVKRLRMYGLTVLHLHTVGRGCPDLLVGWQGANYLIELKNADNVPSKKRLTPDEEKFFSEWRGQVAKCETLEEILTVVGYD